MGASKNHSNSICRVWCIVQKYSINSCTFPWIRGLPFLLFHWDGVTDSCYSLKDSAKRSPHYAARLLAGCFICCALHLCGTGTGSYFSCFCRRAVSYLGTASRAFYMFSTSLIDIYWLPKIWKTPLRVLPRGVRPSHFAQTSPYVTWRPTSPHSEKRSLTPKTIN